MPSVVRLREAAFSSVILRLISFTSFYFRTNLSALLRKIAVDALLQTLLACLQSLFAFGVLFRLGLNYHRVVYAVLQLLPRSQLHLPIKNAVKANTKMGCRYFTATFIFFVCCVFSSTFVGTGITFLSVLIINMLSSISTWRHCSVSSTSMLELNLFVKTP